MKEERRLVLEKTQGRCGYCGVDLKGKFQVDHIISKCFFWAHVKSKSPRVPKFLLHLTESDIEHIDNKLAACASCNNYKSANDLETFRKELKLLTERMLKFTQYKNAKRFGLIEETGKEIVFYFETLNNLSNGKQNNT